MGRQTPEESLKVFAARAVRKRLAGLTREIPGVREASDPEAVHRMRVASRRLRSALEVFGGCFPPRSVRQWNRQMRSLRRALGAARDTDVRIEFLDSLLQTVEDPGVRPGIERLILRQRQLREEEQQHVLRALERLRSSGVTAEMKQALRVLQQKDGRAGEPPGEEAARAILPLLDDLLAFEPCVHRPEEAAGHHCMRIAAKRLRYTVEIFEPLFADRLTGAIAALRTLQDMLGEIHDCDVWSEWLPVFEAEERERTLRYFGSDEAMRALIPGLKFMREEREARRRQSFSEFAAYWVSLGRDSIFEDLRAAVEASSGAATTSD